MANQRRSFSVLDHKTLTGGQVRAEEATSLANYGTDIFTGQVVEAVQAVV